MQKRRARYAFEMYMRIQIEERSFYLCALRKKRSDYKSIRQLAVYGNVFSRMESLLLVFFYTKMLSLSQHKHYVNQIN